MDVPVRAAWPPLDEQGIPLAPQDGFEWVREWVADLDAMTAALRAQALRLTHSQAAAEPPAEDPA